MLTRLGRAAAIAATFLLWVVPAPAATLNDFTSFNVLGDSLSDNGNVYRFTFRQVPRSPPHWNGRFSNGPVWADHIGGEFRARGLPVNNMAYGGAQASGVRHPVPDIPRQRWMLDRRPLGERPLVAILAGANDLFGVIGTGRDALAAGRRAANEIGDVGGSLVRRGATDILAFRLPNLGMIPRYRDTPRHAEAREATRAFNQQFDVRMNTLREQGANVYVVDLNLHFHLLLTNPAAYGMVDTRTPCLQGGVLCPPEVAATSVFFDGVHPTGAAHELIAGLVRDVFAPEPAGMATLAAAVPAPAPVPVPAPAALLVTGLLGLGLVARRRSA